MNPHAVIDAKLQRLHALSHIWLRFLPLLLIETECLATKLSEPEIDVAPTIVIHQRFIAGACRSNPYLLSAPVQINSDGVLRENHERSHARVCIEEAFGMSVAAGRGAEWKQTWPV